MSNAGIALLWSESRRKSKLNDPTQNDQTKNDQTKNDQTKNDQTKNDQTKNGPTQTIPISNFIKRVLDHKIDINEFHKTY
jgi:hypothetical protein